MHGLCFEDNIQVLRTGSEMVSLIKGEDITKYIKNAYGLEISTSEFIR